MCEFLQKGESEIERESKNCPDGENTSKVIPGFSISLLPVCRGDGKEV